VRDRRVFLKTVDGLEQVDVILRRVDDSFCDPLELRSDSLLGVPGLVDAIVAGNVKVANALGSGLIETAAIMPFLPGLCASPARRRPQAALGRHVVVRPAECARLGADAISIGRGQAGVSTRGHGAGLRLRLPQAEKAQIRRQLRPSRTSMWRRSRSRSRPRRCGRTGTSISRSVVLRAYVLNTGSGWVAIPGGLVRVAEAEGSVVSMQRGGHSKDAWVLWDGRSIPSACCVRATSRWSCGASARRAQQRGRQCLLAGPLRRARGKHRPHLRTMVSRVRRARPELACLSACIAAWSRATASCRRRKPRARDFAGTRKGTDLGRCSLDTQAAGQPGLTLAEVSRMGGNVRERLSSDMMFLIGQLRDSMQARATSSFSSIRQC
jgi:hypothetical protein